MALGTGARVNDLAYVFAPHLLFTAAAQFSPRPIKQLECPAFHVFKTHQRVWVLLPLHPRHLIGLLANLLPKLNLIDSRDDFLRDFLLPSK